MKINYFSAGLLLLLSFSLGACNQAKTTENASPTPIPISSIAQLQKIGYDPAYPLDANYILTQDIDAADTQNWNQGRGFAPIGDYELRGEAEDLSLAFNGSFDGQDHAITGLHINRPIDNDVGLFRAIGKNGKITRLGLEDSVIVGGCIVSTLAACNAGTISHCHATGSVSGNEGVGGLVCKNKGTITTSYTTSDIHAIFSTSGGLVAHNYGLITHCHAMGILFGNQFVGGLIGINDTTGIVADSYATGTTLSNIYTFWGWGSCIGGLIGKNYGAVERSRATGNVIGSENSSSSGGLVGATLKPFKEKDKAVAPTITESYALGAVSGQEGVGGLAGSISDGVVEKCCATGAVSGEKEVGGLLGKSSFDSITKQSCATGKVSGNENVGGLIGENDLFTTKSCATGTVSGHINVGGLIGKNDFHIAKSYATGAVSGDENVGGLIGNNDGKHIANSYTTSTASGCKNVGGLVGVNDDSAVVNSHAMNNVLGEESVGGLIGKNKESIVVNSHAVNTVSGNENVGSVIGENYDSVIVYSYSKKRHQGTENIEKRIGKNDALIPRKLWHQGIKTFANGIPISNSSTLESSWFTSFLLRLWPLSSVLGAPAWFSDAGWGLGTPTKEEPAWRFLEKTYQPPFRDSYYTKKVFSLKITATHGQVQSEPAQATYARNASVVLTATPKPGYVFAGWTGQGLGSSVALDLNPLPLVMHANREVTAIFLPDSPIAIRSIADLQKIGYDPAWPLNGHYQLTQDIDATETQKWNRGAGFAPIGRPGYPFRGHFDGQGHAIIGLHINRPHCLFVGLFGITAKDAVITHVGIQNGSISGQGYTGGLVGENYGRIMESYTSCSVFSRFYSGGLVAFNRGVIAKSYATGPVSGKKSLFFKLPLSTSCPKFATSFGGLVGINTDQARIQDSYATGDISGLGPLAGRLAGCNYDGGILINNYATGAVSGCGTADYLVGRHENGKLDLEFIEAICPVITMLLLLALCLINTLLCLISIPLRWWKRRKTARTQEIQTV